MASANTTVEPVKGHKRRNVAILISAVLLLTAIVSALIISQYIDYQQPRYGPGPVTIEIITDKSSYLQGEEVQFHIYVNNPQEWPVQYPSRTKYTIGDLAYRFYSEFVPEKIPTFPAHSRTSYYNYSWNAQVSGNFSVQQSEYITFTVSLGEYGDTSYGDSANCTIEVRPNPNLNNSPSPTLLVLP